MQDPQFEDPAVEAVFETWAPERRRDLLALRALILKDASEAAGIGDVVETLKWGQPSYLPKRPRTGSTVRIDILRDDPEHYAMFFHCQTNLVATFRDIYPDEFDFQGNRALLLRHGDKIPGEAVRHCAALALTYHVDRRRG